MWVGDAAVMGGPPGGGVVSASGLGKSGFFLPGIMVNEKEEGCEQKIFCYA